MLGRLLLHVAAPELAVYRATDGVRVRIPSGEFVLPEKPEDDLLPWTEFALTALGRTGVEFDDVALHEQLQAFEDDERAWELRVFAEMSARSARRGRTFADLRIATPDATDYIVPGFIVPGWATKLAGREKGGKGTFMYYLLGKMERGEDTVFGPTKKTTALVVTEEPIESVEEKATAFGLERGRLMFGYELAGLPWYDETEDCKVLQIVTEAMQDGHRVVFVDNVSRSAGIEDEAGTEMSRAVELLSDACRASGLALVIDHHHKKGRAAIEDKSRGGTALAGAMDINVDLVRDGGLDSRKRKLVARGRLRATNWTRVFELTEDGADYIEVEDEGGDGDDRALMDVLLFTRMAAREPVTAEDFRSQISVKAVRTAQRRLAVLVERGSAVQVPGERQPDGKLGPARWVLPPTNDTNPVFDGMSPVSPGSEPRTEALQTTNDTNDITNDTPSVSPVAENALNPGFVEA